MTAAPRDPLRLASRHAVLGVLTGTTEAGAAEAADRLRRRYAGVPGLAGWRTSWVHLPALRAAVVVAGAAAPDLRQEMDRQEMDVVWGRPIGAAGPATAAEVGAALDQPARAGDLEGGFVLLRAEPDRLRLVTSAAFVFTLRRSGPAFATRAAAALALAGRPLEVDRDAVVEAVVWQAVLQAGEVLAGVEACEEATVVDVSRSGVATRSWSGLGDRLAAQQPLTPAAFRRRVGSVAQRFAAVPGARLALTGGRDSALVASCLAETGAALPAFTMGPSRYADVRAARRVADALGWPHTTVPVTDVRGRTSPLWPAGTTVPGGRLADWLVRHAPWGEGLQHPRDALVGRLRWPEARFCAVSGHSGEVGRATYWDGASDEDLDADPVAVLVGRSTAAHLPPAARDRFADVVAADVRLAHEIGRPRDALDLVYVRRQRCWFDHGWLPDAPVDDVLPVLLAPGPVRDLLDVPRDQRRGGRFFDDAITAWRPELRAVALREAALGKRAWRALGPLNPYLLRDDWPLLTRLLAELAPGGLLVRDLLGAGWWDGALEAARVQPGARGPIWNAVSVEAVHRAAG